MSSAKAPIRLPDWMPSDAKQAWTDLFSVVDREPGGPMRREARYMLQRFVMRSAMEGAWIELARLEEITPSDLVITTFATYISAMRIMPSGAGPVQNAHQSWHELATQVSRAADAIRTVDPSIRVENGITDVTLTELDRVAGFLKSEVAIVDTMINWTPPPRKIRARKAQQVAFVDHMCNRLWQPTERRPYTLVAILANVTFDVSEGKEWDADRVRKCYASRSRDK
jgi:hypothetical protein